MIDTRLCRRRDFLKTTALLGGVMAAGGWIPKVFERLAWARHLEDVDAGRHPYPRMLPEHVIYSVCLQCHTACPIKCKIEEGVLVKIDGNPYCPQTRLNNVPYAASLEEGAKKEGQICPKGQAGIETQYDPYRLRKVLKRDGPRGSNRWKTISFEQAIEEIVNGGDLFGEGHVPGLKDYYRLRDPELAKRMAEDVKAVQKKKMSLAAFKEKYKDHLDVLIDPDHPDKGPLNNKFVFLAGRIEHGRKELMKWFTHNSFGSVNAFEHTTICEQSHHIAYKEITNYWKDGKWTGGKTHMKPDFGQAEYVIFFGTGAFEANFGPPLLSGLVCENLVERNFKFAVVDPRLSKTAAKADRWVPIKPGGDAALAMGMIRWMIDHGRYDRRYLENANKAAAQADGETSWSSATWLVKIENGRPTRYLRASEVTVNGAPLGRDNQFVVMKDGVLKAMEPEDAGAVVEGDLEAAVKQNGWEAETAFRLLKKRCQEKTLDEYAVLAGVDVATIVDLAKEFTAHGKKAAAELYRGPVQHTNGYYNAQAIITLNILIGNSGWKGGLTVGGGHWHEFGGKPGNPYHFKKLNPHALQAFGIPCNRQSTSYEETTLFNGYPAKRTFYPLSKDIYQEVIPSLAQEYPYGAGVLFLHKGTPVFSTPAGHKQIEMLLDTKKFPLFIACDIVIGETSMYADYIIPDVSIWERWGTPHVSPAVLTKVSKVRQPTVAPTPEIVTVDGEEMPICMESFLIAVAKKLGLSGFGKDAFGPGLSFNRPEDFYLKMVANIAMGDEPGDAVPPADDKEMEIFLKARRHLPKAVFDPEKWKKAAGEAYWPHVVTVLNRGGRFEDAVHAYKGDQQAHPWKHSFLLFVERAAQARNSFTGEPFDGLPVIEPVRYADGRPVQEKGRFHLITHKEIFGGQSRTAAPDIWLGELMPENHVLMNRRDAESLGLKQGDVVRVVSQDNPTGMFDLGHGQKKVVSGKVKVIEGIRPGVISVSWHFGHWAYGSNDVVIDGQVVRGDRRRSSGLCTNPVLTIDKANADTCLTDPIGASASFYDTRVDVVKVRA